MKRLLPFLFLLSFAPTAFSQRSDFIVLKKRNNRTLKTYFPGTFITANAYSGFAINGIIKEIKNDSLFVQQQDVFQVQSKYGGLPALDTVIYTIGIFYKDIKQIFFSANTGIGGNARQRGFSEVAGPSILMIGGLGYAGLELVNTLYRKESLSERKKLMTIGIAVAVAGTGFVWHYLQNEKSRAGGKYKIVYVNMKSETTL